MHLLLVVATPGEALLVRQSFDFDVVSSIHPKYLYFFAMRQYLNALTEVFYPNICIHCKQNKAVHAILPLCLTCTSQINAYANTKEENPILLISIKRILLSTKFSHDLNEPYDPDKVKEILKILFFCAND